MTSIPFLSGLPSDESMNSLGNELGNLINPNGKYLNALKAEVIKNPELRQKYIDMEAENPGTLNKMFGPRAANMFGVGNASPTAQQTIFDANNMNTAPSMLPNSMVGIGAAKRLTGSTPDELKEQANRATVTGNQATVSNATVQPDIDEAKLKDAQSLADLQLLPQRIATEQADLSRKEQNQKLLSQTEANPVIAKSGGIINTLVNNPEIIPDQAKAAIMSDNGYYRLYNELHNDKRLNLQEARDDAKTAQERATIDDQINKADAINKSNIAARLGFSVNADDMFAIKKAGLEPMMDKLSQMNGAQLHDAAASDPSIDKIISQHPNLIQSWMHYNSYLQAAGDKDIAPLQKNYNSLKAKFDQNAIKGNFKDDSDAASAISDLTSDPYYDMMMRKGTPLPIPHYDASTFSSKGKTFYTDPFTGKVLDSTADPSKPVVTPVQDKQLDQLAQVIASGTATYKETIADPQFKSFGDGAASRLAVKVNQYRQQMLTKPKSGTPLPPQ